MVFISVWMSLKSRSTKGGVRGKFEGLGTFDWRRMDNVRQLSEFVNGNVEHLNVLIAY
jgi:hypothetical protein